MKKIWKCLLIGCMALFLTACGSKTACYVRSVKQDGLTVEDKQLLKARGDTLYGISETVTVDLNSLEAEEKELMIAYYDRVVSELKEASPEGITLEGGVSQGIYRIRLDIDLETGDLVKLAEKGFIIGIGEGSFAESLSFHETAAGLKAAGYTKEK